MTDLIASGYSHSDAAAEGGFEYTNGDGVVITIEVSGTGAFTDTGSYFDDTFDAWYPNAMPGNILTMTFTFDQPVCVSGSIGWLLDNRTIRFLSTAGTTVSERSNTTSPITITNNGTTNVSVTGTAPEGSDQGTGLFVTHAPSTTFVVEFEVDAGAHGRTDLPFSLYTNTSCTYKWWQHCTTDGLYTNVHNHTETTGTIGSYFTEVDCANVPSTP